MFSSCLQNFVCEKQQIVCSGLIVCNGLIACNGLTACNELIACTGLMLCNGLIVMLCNGLIVMLCNGLIVCNELTAINGLIVYNVSVGCNGLIVWTVMIFLEGKVPPCVIRHRSDQTILPDARFCAKYSHIYCKTEASRPLLYIRGVQKLLITHSIFPLLLFFCSPNDFKIQRIF